MLVISRNDRLANLHNIWRENGVTVCYLLRFLMGTFPPDISLLVSFALLNHRKNLNNKLTEPLSELAIQDLALSSKPRRRC